MSVKKEHTPTPWKLTNEPAHTGSPHIKHGSVSIVSDNDDPWFIAEVIGNCGMGPTPTDESKANAAFIVEACNSHSRLVQENEEMKKMYEEMKSDRDSVWHAYESERDGRLKLEERIEESEALALKWYKQGFSDAANYEFSDDAVETHFHQTYSKEFNTP